uniref:piggyBac transposable element-derived protein 4-like n=1 Tax=Osmia lignaria TaxID=473952 RepID=UPI00147812D8|nr:piggyBac transposable element-derived protein 4-like [Osmia lignaria]
MTLRGDVLRKIIDTNKTENEIKVDDGAGTSSNLESQEIIMDESDVDFGSDDTIIDDDCLPNTTNREYISDEVNINENNTDEVLRNLALQEDELNKSGNEQIDDDEFMNDWTEYMGRHKTFLFIGKHGSQKMISPNSTPLEIFRLIVDEEVINYIVTKTNRFPKQTINAKLITYHARITKWIPTDAGEMEKFFGLMMWMGLVRLPTLPDYWSNQGIYQQQVPRDRLRKIQSLIDILERKFKELFYPGEDIVIDETLVPWRRRLIFKQYKPNKAHRYGIKLCKLSLVDSYTWTLKIFPEQSSSSKRHIGLAKQLCLKLTGSLLNKAKSLLEQKTHVTGTLRANKKDISKEILLAKLKREEIISREDSNEIVVLNWEDIHDVWFLSTKHTPHLVPINNLEMEARPSTTKPIAILAYNKAKAGTDLSDQMASYCTTLRKGVKWYRKLAIELILGSAVVNAWIIYKHLTKKIKKHNSHGDCRQK